MKSATGLPPRSAESTQPTAPSLNVGSQTTEDEHVIIVPFQKKSVNGNGSVYRTIRSGCPSGSLRPAPDPSSQRVCGVPRDVVLPFFQAFASWNTRPPHPKKRGGGAVCPPRRPDFLYFSVRRISFFSPSHQKIQAWPTPKKCHY